MTMMTTKGRQYNFFLWKKKRNQIQNKKIKNSMKEKSGKWKTGKTLE